MCAASNLNTPQYPTLRWRTAVIGAEGTYVRACEQPSAAIQSIHARMHTLQGLEVGRLLYCKREESGRRCIMLTLPVIRWRTPRSSYSHLIRGAWQQAPSDARKGAQQHGEAC